MPTEKGIIELARHLGREKGQMEGIAQGIGEGLVQGLREAIVQVIEERFGKVYKSNAKKLAAASEPWALLGLHRLALRIEHQRNLFRNKLTADRSDDAFLNMIDRALEKRLTRTDQREMRLFGQQLPAVRMILGQFLGEAAGEKFLQEVIQPGMKSFEDARSRGFRAGRQAGRSLGAALAFRQAVLHVLRARFGRRAGASWRRLDPALDMGVLSRAHRLALQAPDPEAVFELAATEPDRTFDQEGSTRKKRRDMLALPGLDGEQPDVAWERIEQWWFETGWEEATGTAEPPPELEPVMQYLVRRSRTLGEREGYSQALKEYSARAAGALRQAALEILQGHFGPVPETVAQRLQAVEDLERLSALVRLSVRADSLKAVLAAL